MDNDAGKGSDDRDPHLILHLPARESEDRLSCCCILSVGSSVRLCVCVCPRATESERASTPHCVF